MTLGIRTGRRKAKEILRRAQYAIKTARYKPVEAKVIPIPRDLAKIGRYTMSTSLVLEKHYRLGYDVAARDVAGDLVECGVCNGGSAAALAYGLGPGTRRVWLYDSFEGLPPVTARDGELAPQWVGACVGSEQMVREALALVHVPEASTVIRKGWFQDTFAQPLPETVALLHLDCDWYESMMLSLNTFYDRVPEGGTIILDDFGHWEGCREAFYDFVQARGIKPLLERFGHSQAFWVKGRLHNRDYSSYWEIP